MKLFKGTNTIWKNLQIAKHQSVQCAWVNVMTMICALQFAAFLRLCLSPRATSRTISCSISNSFLTIITSEQLRWHIWPTFPLNFFMLFSHKDASLLFTWCEKKWLKTRVPALEDGQKITTTYILLLPFVRHRSYVSLRQRAAKEENNYKVATHLHILDVGVFALSATPTTPAHTVQLGRCKLSIGQGTRVFGRMWCC